MATRLMRPARLPAALASRPFSARQFHATAFRMSASPVTSIKSLEHFDSLVKTTDGKPVVLDCFAEWCGPCKAISPIFEQQSTNFKDSVTFAKLDVDEQVDVSRKLGIRAMPTFYVFKDGQKIAELVGADPNRLIAMIREASKLGPMSGS